MRLTQGIVGAVAAMLTASCFAAEYSFSKPVVVPTPAQSEWRLNTCVRLAKGETCVRLACPAAAQATARTWLQRHFESAFGFACALTVEDAVSLSEPEAYVLSADPMQGVTIRATNLVGVRWAFATLRQIAMRDREGMTSDRWILPACTVRDAPKLAFRGYHLCWFPEQKPVHIERQIRLAAYYKFNYVVLENWGVWRSVKHPWFGWPDGTMTLDEMKRLRAVAEDLGVTLVPQLNILGHASLSRVMTGNHATLDFAPEYEPLFEPYSGWNWCLSNPAARRVIKELAVELHETFGNPPFFHIGCDEGCPPTCPKCRAADYNKLVSSLLKEVTDLFASRSAAVMMWHDMLLEAGNPRWDGFVANGDARAEELLKTLPKSLVICDWFYSGPLKAYPTVDYFKAQGFRVLTSPSNGCLDGTAAQGRMAVEKGIFGLLQTTWAAPFGRNMSGGFPVAACAAWGTEYPAAQLPQDWTAPVNAHLRQVLQDMGNRDRTLTGFFAEQMPSRPISR